MSANGKGEVSGHDDFGSSDDARRIEHRRKSMPKDEGRVAKADAELAAAAEDFLSAHGFDEDDPELVGQIALAIQTGWAGPLPPPDILKQYDQETQKHIIAWNDMQVSGEVNRAMYIAETERISVEKSARATTRNQWLSTLLNTAFVGCSLVAFIITGGNPVSFGFLAVPGVTIAVNVIESFTRRK